MDMTVNLDELYTPQTTTTSLIVNKAAMIKQIVTRLNQVDEMLRDGYINEEEHSYQCSALNQAIKELSKDNNEQTKKNTL